MTLCHLCELPIPPWATTNHPLAPSRDHIVPRRDGGTGLPNNTALAHRCCNQYRRHHPITRRMRRRCRVRAEAEFQKAGEPTPTVSEPLDEALPDMATLAALPVHARRAVIVRVVAELARVYVGEGAVIAPGALPRLRDAVGNLARKYFAPPRSLMERTDDTQ